MRDCVAGRASRLPVDPKFVDRFLAWFMRPCSVNAGTIVITTPNAATHHTATQPPGLFAARPADSETTRDKVAGIFLLVLAGTGVEARA